MIRIPKIIHQTWKDNHIPEIFQHFLANLFKSDRLYFYALICLT